MFAIILAAVMSSKGIPSKAIDDLVIVEGRPGCTVSGLYHDPTRPVMVCK